MCVCVCPPKAYIQECLEYGDKLRLAPIDLSIALLQNFEWGKVLACSPQRWSLLAHAYFIAFLPQCRFSGPFMKRNYGKSWSPLCGFPACLRWNHNGFSKAFANHQWMPLFPTGIECTEKNKRLISSTFVGRIFESKFLTVLPTGCYLGSEWTPPPSRSKSSTFQRSQLWGASGSTACTASLCGWVMNALDVV